MEIIEAIGKRRSIRAYTGEPVTDGQLGALLEAAYASPAAGGNRAKMRVAAVRDAGLIGHMRGFVQGQAGMKADPFYNAGTLLVLSGEEDLGDAALFANAGCILENVQLAAMGLGLGSCIIWACGTVLPQSPELVAQLGVPEGFKPLAGLVVGEAAKQPPERKAAPHIETTYLG